MKSITLATIISSAVLIGGCATSTTNDCDWAKPIRPSKEEQLSRGTTEQIVIHNETGEKLCGWRP